MTSEGTDTLILAVTSKMGQSVSRNIHRIFLFEFFCQREDIISHFVVIFSVYRCEGFSN